MTFVKFEKAYPNYLAYTDKGKVARITVDNDRNVKVYGISGKEINTQGRYSYAFRDCPVMDALIRFVNEHDFWKDTCWKYYQYTDSCYSLGMSPIPYDKLRFFLDKDEDNDISMKLLLAKTPELSNASFKEICDCIVTALCKKAGLSDVDIQFYKDHEYISYKEYIHNKKYRHLIQKLWILPLARVLGYRKMNEYVNNYMEYCEKTGIPMETGDFWANYLKVENTYKAMQEELEQETFIKSQKSIPLFFEDEDFITIIPMSKKEVVEEGAKLRNCLGTYEWNNFLSTGDRQVVFIRRKSAPEKSYIACDIDDGVIQQYLTYCNAYVTDEDAEAFRDKYQDYLNSLK